MLRLLPVITAFIAIGHCTTSKAEPIELNCRIEPHVRIEVSSAAEGVVAEMLADKNQMVQKGEVLARLESSFEAATADLRKLQADVDSHVDAQTLALAFAARNLKRLKNLHSRKAASSSELDKAKTEQQLAEQQLRQAKDRKRQASFEHKRALADLGRKTVKSPIAGMVTERYKEPGEHIYFEPLLQLVQLDPLRVEAFAPAHLFGLIKEGAPAQVKPELALGKKNYSAKVERVDKVIDAPSNTFGLVLSIPNKNLSLPSGLKCRVEFTNLKQDSSLLD